LPAFPQDFGSLALRRKTGQAVRTVRLNREEFRFGREMGNELVLPDQGISRRHCRLLCRLEGCWIEDLRSQNGTFLNDERLAPNEPRQLIEGDTIRIGEYLLVYYGPQPVAPAEDDEFVLTFAEPVRPVAEGAVTGWSLPPRSSYLQHLPSFFSQDSLMDRFLLIFESILAPIEQIADHLPLILDPRTQPADTLPWFAAWLDLTLNENWPEAHRRDLIRSASELYRWRGTRHGLSRYLEIYAAVTPVIEDVLERPHTFRVTLRVPSEQQVDEELVHQIIQNEKPAQTAYELVIEHAEPPEPPPVPPPAAKPKKPKPEKGTAPAAGDKPAPDAAAEVAAPPPDVSSQPVDPTADQPPADKDKPPTA